MTSTLREFSLHSPSLQGSPIHTWQESRVNKIKSSRKSTISKTGPQASVRVGLPVCDL